MLDFDLENTPLEIKTDSATGSSDKVEINFFNQLNEYAGGVKIFFSSMQYSLVDCLYEYTGYDFQNTPTTDDNKVWRITLAKTSDTRRFVIHCNEVEVLNVQLSDNFCEERSSYWNRDVTMIEFSVHDTASSLYKTYTPGGLSVFLASCAVNLMSPAKTVKKSSVNLQL